MADRSLAGCRVLVIEDEFLIALDIEEILEALGCVAAGIVRDRDSAVDLARFVHIDAAVVDVFLHGDTSLEVAAVLFARGVPVLLTTGADEQQIPSLFRDMPIVRKPFGTDQLRVGLIEALGRRKQ